MKGAEALLRTLLAGGVDVCFTNPGTSEMQFVAALDRVPQMRAILALFEGVVTGAADGYARMAGKPAATLLHLGPGLANGLSNLHNAMKADVPLVNIVGNHATYHQQYDAPLTSDVAGYARPVSRWLHSTSDVASIAADTAAAVIAARRAPGQIATLITPADVSWSECAGPAQVPDPVPPERVDETAITEAAAALHSGEPCILLVTGSLLREGGLALAGRIATSCGARLMSPTFFARLERGAGRVPIERVPYIVEQAVQALASTRHLILVGSKEPVAFFAYPNLPSLIASENTQIHTLARPDQDLEDALERLADAVGARTPAPVQQLLRPGLPNGPITVESLAYALGALLPEGCIVVEEAITSGFPSWNSTAGAPPHDWLLITGGSIGIGMPLATGAAVACPDRRVLNLQADGSAAYTMQALWTQAREQLNVTTVLYSNRAYRILEMEYLRADAGQNPGPLARRVMSISEPEIDWVSMARGMGVPGKRVETIETFAATLQHYMREPGPNLIEVML